MHIHSIPLATAPALLLPGSFLAQSPCDEGIKPLIAGTVRGNPEPAPEALRMLEMRQIEDQSAAAALTNERAMPERDPNASAPGNPNGDVTVVAAARVAQ